MDDGLGIEEPGIPAFHEDSLSANTVGQEKIQFFRFQSRELMVVREHSKLHPDAIESIEIGKCKDRTGGNDTSTGSDQGIGQCYP